MMFEKDIQRELGKLRVIAENTRDGEIFDPVLMSLIGELKSIHGWTDEQCVAALKATTEETPLILRDGVKVWCELDS